MENHDNITRDGDDNSLEGILGDSNGDDAVGITEEMVSMASDAPQTVRDFHEAVGEEAGLSRAQTRYRAQKLAEAGSLESRKATGETSPRIFWRD